MKVFADKLALEKRVLKKRAIDVLQVNLGKLCNLTCVHCHVEAGPTKTVENMNQETAQAVVRCMDSIRPHTLDLTGGAPEMNPSFRYLVAEAKKRNLHVIDRCNLSVLFEKGQEDLAQFLKVHEVEVYASLPCYQAANVDKQRGRGTFEDSLRALKCLNALGYGEENGVLRLNLVYNPVGAHLPPPQETLEREYKLRLQEDFGVYFNHLVTITNMPITRYKKYLRACGELEAYEALLRSHFNAATLDDLMCLNTLNIGWDGKFYDCDFNQMLEMEMRTPQRMSVFDFDPAQLVERNILTGDHCFGCTAGAGSSCQGALSPV